MKPLVSVLMSVYNEDDGLLHKSISSLISQTLENWELLVVDDGNNPNTQKVIKSFRDSRIRLIVNSLNLGLTKSLNRAASFARGEYYARLDSDDYCLPSRLEKQVSFLMRNPSIVACGSGYNELVGSALKPQHTRLILSHDDIIKSLPRLNPLAHSTLMIRASGFSAVGGYDEYFYYAQDYDLLFRLSKVGKLCNLEESLVVRNISYKNISYKNYREQMRYALKTRSKATFDCALEFGNILYLTRSYLISFLPQRILLFLRALLSKRKSL